LTALVQSIGRAEGLCVLGAGNGDDLDLPALVRKFGSVDLVDIDGAALTRSIARLPDPERKCLVPHGGIDLAGYLHEVDAWEKSVPGLGELLEQATETADSMVSAVGSGPFDVVLSSCVLTQLWVPLKRTLVLSAGEWNRIFALMSFTHLLVMAKLTRPGGTAILATEVAAAPLKEPNLDVLMTLLSEHPDLSRLVQSPRLAEPWVWTLDGKAAVTHAVIFDRAVES
jgi:hypothetical protein